MLERFITGIFIEIALSICLTQHFDLDGGPRYVLLRIDSIFIFGHTVSNPYFYIAHEQASAGPELGFLRLMNCFIFVPCH